MKSEDVTLITSAIASRQCIEIDYPPGRRVVAPHILGKTSSGEMVLSAYQLEGASESNETTGWKTFYLDRIIHLGLLEQKFSPQPDYNPRDAKIAHLIARI